MNKLIIVVAIQFAALAYCSIGFSQSNPDLKISMYGLALPNHQATIRSSINSQVKKVHVREGQEVKQGELLVQLECEPAKARKHIAELAANESGSKSNAAAELEFAQKNFDRFKKLHDQNAVNENEWHEASLRLKRAQAGYQIEVERSAANKARFELASAELEQYFLRAPFDGYVTSVSASPGDPVTSDSDILQLVSMDQLRMELYLPFEQAQKVQVGQSYPLQVQSPFEHEQVMGKVVFRSPIIESTTGTLRFVFEIDNHQRRLPAGFTAFIETLE